MLLVVWLHVYIYILTFAFVTGKTIYFLYNLGIYLINFRESKLFYGIVLECLKLKDTFTIKIKSYILQNMKISMWFRL